MDTNGLVLLVLAGAGALAGARWRRARILGAIVVTVLAIGFLEITPGAWARAIVADAGQSPDAACREDFLYPLIEATRREARIWMLPILILGIWAVVGDLWSGGRAEPKPPSSGAPPTLQ